MNAETKRFIIENLKSGALTIHEIAARAGVALKDAIEERRKFWRRHKRTFRYK